MSDFQLKALVSAIIFAGLCSADPGKANYAPVLDTATVMATDLLAYCFNER